MENSVETVSSSTLFIISAREKGGSDFDLSEAPEKLGLEGDYSAIRARGTIDIKGKRIYIGGYVDFSLKETCSRCAEEFTQTFSEKFTFIFLPEGKGGRRDSEGSDFFFYSGNEINFADGIRDTVLLALPLKPLCSEDCTGIDY